MADGGGWRLSDRNQLFDIRDHTFPLRGWTYQSRGVDLCVCGDPRCHKVEDFANVAIGRNAVFSLWNARRTNRDVVGRGRGCLFVHYWRHCSD